MRAVAFENEESIAAQNAIALSPDGSLLATLIETVKGSRKGIETTGQVVLWDVTTGRKTQTLRITSSPVQFGTSGKLSSVAFSGDGAWLAVRDEESMKIWDAATGRELKSFVSPKIFRDSADPSFSMFASKFLFSPDRRLVSLVNEGSKINLLDSSSNTRLYTLAGHNGAIVGVSFSSDGAGSFTARSSGKWRLAPEAR